jgi:hypothetical protein
MQRYTLFFFFMLLSSAAYSQSVIVSVPNTVVVPKQSTMLAHESQFNTWTFDKAYWNSFSFACYGVGYNTEVCATLFGVSRPGSSNLAVAVGFKSIVPIFTESTHEIEPTLSFGQMIPVSLSGRGVGTWTYGVSSIKVPGLHTRLTGGLSYGTRQIFGRDILCFMGGYEQPLSEKLFFIGDWYGGRHDLGAAVIAGQYNFTPHIILIVGYKIPNSALAGPQAIISEITYEF